MEAKLFARRAQAVIDAEKERKDPQVRFARATAAASRLLDGVSRDIEKALTECADRGELSASIGVNVAARSCDAYSDEFPFTLENRDLLRVQLKGMVEEKLREARFSEIHVRVGSENPAAIVTLLIDVDFSDA